MKIVALAQAYNEEEFIESWLQHILSFCATAVVYDDGSTDRTLEILLKYLPESHVIHSDTNDHANETMHHEELLQRIHKLNLNPDWIFTNSIDERLPYSLTPERIHTRLQNLQNKGVIYMKQAELYLHPHYMRLDNLWGQVPFVRFYRYKRSLSILNPTGGLPHSLTHPPVIHSWKYTLWSERMLHYGYLSKERILRRFDIMVKCYEEGRFGNMYKYTNWVRTIDFRTWTTIHIPPSWLKEKCNEEECVPFTPTTDWLISPDDWRWKYVEMFGLHVTPPITTFEGV